MSTNKLNVLDLFSGCGGMSTGLKDAGFNIIAAIDVWQKAIDSYNKNFDNHGICADLTELSPEKFNELYNKNKEIIDLLVGGPPCFIPGTLVLTDNGYKKIEDIDINNKLLTHTGKFQKIVNLQRKIYSGDLYEIDITNHRRIVCTEEHPFYVRKRYDTSTNTHIDTDTHTYAYTAMYIYIYVYIYLFERMSVCVYKKNKIIMIYNFFFNLILNVFDIYAS